jgi:hypothetical protein
MALDESALLELLEALKAADVDDRIRTATETLYQAPIEAELTAVIGAAPHERTESRTAQRNGPAADRDHHGRGSGAADSAAAGRVVPPLADENAAGGSTRLCSRW